MSTLINKEYISWVTGIYVVRENETDYAQRVAKDRQSLEEHHKIATEALTELLENNNKELVVNSARGFAIATRHKLAYYQPARRERWLEMRGCKIPLPSTRS